MSVLFDDTVDTRYYFRSVSLPTPTAFSISFYARRTSTTQIQKTIFSLDNNTTTSPSATVLQTEADASHTVRLTGIRQGTSQQTTGQAMTVNTWWWHCIIVNGTAYNHVACPAGTTNATNQGFTHASSTIDPPTRLRVANSHVLTETWGGELAALKVWDAVLTTTELGKERWMYQPYRTDQCIAFIPLLEPSNATVDWSAVAASLSNAGSGQASSLEAPPIMWGPVRRRIFIPAGAAPGQTINLGVVSEIDLPDTVVAELPGDVTISLPVVLESDTPLSVTQSTDLFWTSQYLPMSYLASIIPDPDEVPCDILVDTTVAASAWSFKYRTSGSALAWTGTGTATYWSGDTNPFWSGGSEEFLPWPGRLHADTRQVYEFLIETAPGPDPGIVSEYTIKIDVPDIRESFPQTAIAATTGTRLPIAKSYRAIKIINLTLQDGGTGRVARYTDTGTGGPPLTAGPLIKVFDSANAIVAGTVTAEVIGY